MISNLEKKAKRRNKRKRSIRKRIMGTAERPRLTVFRSAKNIYAQVIDDLTGTTLATASTLEKDLRGTLKGSKKKVQAQKVGNLLAERCLQKNIKAVVFDRNGYTYHGRIASVAAGAREKGLSF